MEKLNGGRLRIGVSFLAFGLLNNLLYVVILSAALDLVGNNVSKGVVLFSNILPSLLCKASAPIVHLNEYSPTKRIHLCVLLSFVGMQWVVWSQKVWLKMVGVAIAAVSSSLGEVTFLQLCHRYPSTTMAFWGSGTGLAGLLGSSCYLALTVYIGLSVHTTLLSSSVFPLLILVFLYFVLPKPEYEPVSPPSPSVAGDTLLPISIAGGSGNVAYKRGGLLRYIEFVLRLWKPYFARYMFPLFLVYFSEYTVNIGIAPTLLFPLGNTSFKQYRDFYPAYQTAYQLGVFLSRSSIALFEIPWFPLLSYIQFGLLVLMTCQSLFMLFTSVHFILFLFLVEGLIGGCVYVNVYHSVPGSSRQEKERAIGIVGVSDSTGIFLASLCSLVLEHSLCSYQVSHGREWCTLP
ncbi:battenin CLN3 family protein [Schizosaccharomyces japonicus yFS275]|uniref:Protein BTN n=1 Tax=Schizosaccharomyces japonicus (strain yFS275 / FY16936) TaxID=402676 RepID=B6K0Z8_SCHJY|nr:battenin CLN3 family protein [Schizosaccharomyces japonicus yFS275]EEB07619.1 battenin CLN3 family protein [Schizosaccharomyces japonicus yFS275]